MKISHLANTPFDVILNCFFDSFSDYFVDVRIPGDFWQKRWASDRVDFRYSYGIFDEGKLVGFILNGIDFRAGKKTAFNAGTGVLPAYRGRRIVKELYTHALPELKAQGIQSCALEVIDKNEKAIKAIKVLAWKLQKHINASVGHLTFQILPNLI